MDHSDGLLETTLVLCARVVYTLYGCNEMVAVPVAVLISVYWFPVYNGVDGVVWSW